MNKTAKVEVRIPASLRDKFRLAAERRGASLSDWVRRRLDEAAEEELGRGDEPPPPSGEDIREALKARGALRGTGLRERVKGTRGPWTVSR